MNQRLFGKIPSPLEVLDAGLDAVAEVVQFPARLGSELAASVQHTAAGVKGAVDQPKNYAEIPAPPDVVVNGALEAVSSVAGGVIEGVTGVLDAFQQTGLGVKGQIDTLVKR